MARHLAKSSMISKSRVFAVLTALSAAITENTFEVWMIDQSNTNGTAYGGTIYIYNGPDLMGASLAKTVPAATIDLGAETSAMCLESTGANPVRPHMVLFNAAHTHASIAFVASGHVVIFDAVERKPIACLRSSAGAGGARQAHAGIPTADNKYILVANQNGKLLERIDVDYETNTYTLNSAATIDLAACTTPSGAACQASDIRPDNAPICPIVDDTSSFGFITLRGGGMFVVDVQSTPMRIVAEYDKSTVNGNGCGGIQAAGSMWINSGGATASNLDQFDVYRFPLTGYADGSAANTPAPTVVFSDPATSRDSHGMAVSKDTKYLWVFDRAGNVAEVFDTKTNKRLKPVRLATKGSPDPTPDLVDISPAGNRLFTAMRGPMPLSGDPHASTGSTPGMMVIELEKGGQTGKVKGTLAISNKDAGGVERADAHGIRVRQFRAPISISRVISLL